MLDTDKRTIGLTENNRELVEKLINEFHFSERIHVAKFGMAPAMKNGVVILSLLKRQIPVGMWAVLILMAR